ncbi:M67 family metallopeptidase [Paenibacillus glycanilyticus]|uniref:Mov34/MPN/PAD-1 family protein n=1 Tax=Paenibacillus glycanilyticus TaxID=126569 RepID=A0ABQ6GG68_9BACL|nr:M67 family metallopeptidase [Paenibacillus glycanilyticus]GLX69245.1 Mov34/MPN/PAD-1 family protein [Paenibacillus glycanilyticus]
MSTIAITQSAYIQLIERCQQELPREACGVLTGTAATQGIPAIVTHVHAITNIHEDPFRSFRFHPGEWVSVYYDMQKNRQTLVGFFHSHPTSSVTPSKRDWLGLPASEEQASYWIISMADGPVPVVQPYRHAGQTFCPLTLMFA